MIPLLNRDLNTGMGAVKDLRVEKEISLVDTGTGNGVPGR